MHAELLDLLRSLSDQEAQGILARLRSGTDLRTILKQVQAGDVLTQFPVAPGIRLRYEFPYIKHFPRSLLEDNAYLESIIYKVASPHIEFGAHNPPRVRQSLPPERLGSMEYPEPYLKPIHAAHVVETLLSEARPSLWTRASDNDDLMRDLLASFFRSEYTSQPIFQKDLFLEDMVKQKSDFCSPLLVNSVFAYCCVCFEQVPLRSEFWNPQSLSYVFLAEARRLWELEAKKPLITTIQAAVALNLVYNMSGLDEIGRAYGVQAVTLARNMNLLEGCVEGDNPREIQGRVFTAWMIYNIETMVAFHFKHLPLLPTSPAVYLPDPQLEPEWYGDIWLKYPMTQVLTSTSFAAFFDAKCSLRTIISDICQAYFADDVVVTWELALSLHYKLDSWLSQLPKCLTAKYIVFPGQFQLHIEYQNAVMALYEPLLGHPADDAKPHSTTGKARSIMAQATKHFEMLVRLYYLLHGFDATDVFLCQPLALVGIISARSIGSSTSMEDIEAPRSTLFLAAKGLSQQGNNYPLASVLLAALQGEMRPEERTMLKSALGISNERWHWIMKMQGIQTNWPISFTAKPPDLEEHRLRKLIAKFAKSQTDGHQGET